MSLKSIAHFLQERIGVDFDSLGVTSLSYAIERRIKHTSTATAEGYMRLLHSSRTEQQELIEQIVVPETWFFREPKSFSTLADRLAPWKQRAHEHPITIQCLGCCTGEEAWSIAIALAKDGWSGKMCTIRAYDISLNALAKAEKGVYTKRSFRNSNMERFEDAFLHEDSRWIVNEHIRELVCFSPLNLMDYNHSYSGSAAIFCRNVLIYMKPDIRNRLVHQMVNNLLPGGFLFLGASESLQRTHPELERLNQPGSFAFTKRVHFTNTDSPKPASKKLQSDAHSAKSGPVGKIHPKPAPVFEDAYRTAKTTADHGNHALALAQCRQLIRDFGAQASTFSLMGLVYHSMNEPDMAQEWFRKALYMDSNHYETLVHYAYLLKQSGEISRARHFLDRARDVYNEQHTPVEVAP